MKFLSIRIQNLFSYRDGVFEFPETEDPKKNVVLIHGRNGFGKTSFINSLKLFFVGSEDDEIRAVIRGRQYSARDYILGGGAEWEGAFNRRALADKEKECSITVTWRETKGVVVAKRSWTIEGPAAVREHLQIWPGFEVEEGTLEDAEQRQDFVDRRLPRALVPFFIYDAEHVQRIAESNSEAVLEQIERLLDITAINTADTYVGRVLQKLRRESNARQEQLKLESLRGQHEVAVAKRGTVDAEIEAAEEQDNENKRRLTELERRLRNSKAAANEQTESVLKAQLNDRKTMLEEKASSFLENFPAVAPLVSHPHLIARALEKLKASSQGRAQLVDELQGILERLPVRLFDEPQLPKPALTDSQKRFFKQKVALLIESEMQLAAGANDDESWAISVDRARKVESQLRAFADTTLRESYAGNLRDISKLARDDLALKAQLDDLSMLPKADREKQQERRAEKAALEESSESLREKIGALRASLIPVAREIEKLRLEVAYQERRVSEATRNQVSVEIADKALKGIRLYRGALKQARQQEIEATMNKHFQVLMESNTLVASIRFDEDFKMKYFDSDENAIGMSNISAGMKQLAAQALLWALKDVSGSACPVVIDTPLARIDAGHQHLLITKYYPAAAEQVIVLPTDSELDAAKYAMLKPYIATEFCLHNPRGDVTTVSSGQSMYSVEVAL